MSSDSWRPKVGERVAIYGTVEAPSGKGFDIHVDGGDINPQYFQRSELSPLPAPAAPRPAWEVLEHAAGMLDRIRPGKRTWWTYEMRQEARALEAAAAPKPPPTLAEAVRAYLDKPGFWKHVDELREALARAEAGQ